MIPKPPRTRYRNLVAAATFFVVTEVSLLTGGYFLVAACNRSQDFRRRLFQANFVTISLLDFYYRITESYGNNAVREFDRTTWKAQGVIGAGGREINLKPVDKSKLSMKFE